MLRSAHELDTRGKIRTDIGLTDAIELHDVMIWDSNTTSLIMPIRLLRAMLSLLALDYMYLSNSYAIPSYYFAIPRLFFALRFFTFYTILLFSLHLLEVPRI